MLARSAKSTAWSRHWQLLLLAFANWVVTYSRIAIGPLQEWIARDLHLSDTQMALLQGPALAVPMVLAAIPAGIAIDRYPRVPFIRVGVLCASASLVLSAVADSLVLLFLARALLGAFYAMVLVTVYATAADLYAAGFRGRATMVVSLGENTAAPAAFAIGGNFLALSGLYADQLGVAEWRLALLLMAAVTLPFALLTQWLREPARNKDNARPPLREVWACLWRLRAMLVPLLAARVMLWVADGAVIVWATPMFVRKFAMSAGVIGTLMGTSLLITCLVGPILGGAIADFCQRQGGPRLSVYALAAIALLCVPFGLFGIAGDPILAMTALTIFMTLGFTILVAAVAVSMVVLPMEMRGLYMAITVFVAGIFSVGVAPLAVSTIASFLHGPSAIGSALAISSVIMSIAGTLVFASSARHFEARRAG